MLRDVQIVDGFIEATITPTYSGCPAMNLIALNVEAALEEAGFVMPRIKTVLSPAWTTDWMTEEGKAKLGPMALRRRPARRHAAPCSAKTRLPVRIAAQAIPSAFPNWIDRLQGIVALQGVRRAVRLFQVHLRRRWRSNSTS